MDARRLTVNQCCRQLSRTSREHSAQRTWHVEGFRSVGANAFDTWSKAHQAIHVAGELDTFEVDPVRFLERFLTQDECWIHQIEPETKRQSMQWKHPSSPPPKKAKVVSSAGKMMASLFWDAKGIVFIAYLQKGQTINGEYMPTCRGICKRQSSQNGLVNWRGEPCFSRRMLLHTGLWLQWLLCVIVALNWLVTLPYSPDSVPSDYFCSPTWKTKDIWLESTVAPMMRPYLQLRTFSRIRMRASITTGIKALQTPMEELCGETMLQNKPHLVKFDQCIIVCLWTFQPTLVYPK